MCADASETLWIVFPNNKKGSHKIWCRLKVCVMRYGGRGGGLRGIFIKWHGGPHLETSENALLLALFIRSYGELNGKNDGVVYFVIRQRKECENGGKRGKFPRFGKKAAPFPPSKCSDDYETWCVSTLMLGNPVVKI